MPHSVETSLCRLVWNVFRYLEPFGRGSRVWRTDRLNGLSNIARSNDARWNSRSMKFTTIVCTWFTVYFSIYRPYCVNDCTNDKPTLPNLWNIRQNSIQLNQPMDNLTHAHCSVTCTSTYDEVRVWVLVITVLSECKSPHSINQPTIKQSVNQSVNQNTFLAELLVGVKDTSSEACKARQTTWAPWCTRPKPRPFKMLLD